MEKICWLIDRIMEKIADVIVTALERVEEVNVKPHLARMAVGLAQIITGLMDILSLGYNPYGLSLKAAEFFAKRHWFDRR